MTIKNLLENEELMNNIMEDLDEIPECSEVFYAVWALGHTADDEPTDDEVLIGEFTDPDEAIAFADKATIELVNEMGFREPCAATDFFTIEIETVVADPYGEDGCIMNIGTIYQRVL